MLSPRSCPVRCSFQGRGKISRHLRILAFVSKLKVERASARLLVFVILSPQYHYLCAGLALRLVVDGSRSFFLIVRTVGFNLRISGAVECENVKCEM